MKTELNTSALLSMTLRDFFAAVFLSSGHVFKSLSPGNNPAHVAEQAYIMADAMLEARNENHP